jgi:hypothetical protein
VLADELRPKHSSSSSSQMEAMEGSGEDSPRPSGPRQHAMYSLKRRTCSLRFISGGADRRAGRPDGI